ncbi:protein-tyrosine phosphatase [Keratinibaculum paraultunense]|uniref:Protein-tyrosine phosphatase n=1 Tax=Keratinibaculum paraultunense TaxID=1278232 RepID=A0A4R3KUS4_9FIRM|nr:low molecular weight protein arginine phosphatase [Keratinibaculum paraultunense]QQY79189.1 low molecular weight protein arginine phosphatase [Keratinibaculum paraultunense]TCS88573.1 protein-tyrosine phosphatase [Keratinibaculum paraultunense]
MNILFVCTGNTCRSPMAQGLLDDMAKKKGLNLEVKSAGIFTLDGQRASEEAVEVLKEEGIDISNHKANIIYEDLVEDADLILTMTKSHKETLLSKYDFLKGKVFTLKEYAYGIEEDVLDPFGKSVDVYRKTKEDIKKALEEIIKKGGFTNENRHK